MPSEEDKLAVIVSHVSRVLKLYDHCQLNRSAYRERKLNIKNFEHLAPNANLFVFLVVQMALPSLKK